MKEITDKLEHGILELFESERYQNYLRIMAKFHDYSLRNTVLISMQKPDATLVAGFSAWNTKFSRNVIRGEKGIRIIAPSPIKRKAMVDKIDPLTQKKELDSNGQPVKEQQEIMIPAYKVVTVFDVSQTQGKELPSIAVDELKNQVAQYKDFLSALEKTSPVPIHFKKIGGQAHGYYDLNNKSITIKEGMGELQTLKTAVHEIAHAKLHDVDFTIPEKERAPRKDAPTREVEAESVAYTVCQHYGLDTSDYSFGYIAGWSKGKELEELKGSLETIHTASKEIIQSIDLQMKEIQKTQKKEKNIEQGEKAETSKEKILESPPKRRRNRPSREPELE